MRTNRLRAFDERSKTGNRIVDIELFVAVINSYIMLGCYFCKNTSIILLEDCEVKKGLASFLTIKCTLCDFCTDFYPSGLCDNTFDINTRAAYVVCEKRYL